jgi:hypothetical protein
VKKLTGGFDNGLGAVLIGKHSLVLFLSRKSLEGILGLFQQYRSKAAHSFHARMSAATSCGHGPSSESDVMGHFNSALQITKSGREPRRYADGLAVWTITPAKGQHAA